MRRGRRGRTSQLDAQQATAGLVQKILLRYDSSLRMRCEGPINCAAALKMLSA